MRGIVASGRALGTSLPRTSVLEITRLVQAIGAVRYATVISSVPVLSAALAKQRVARLLETLEQVLVGVPALASLVVATPGAQLFGLWARPCIAALPARGLALKLASRIVGHGLATSASTTAPATRVHAAARLRLETTFECAWLVSTAVFFINSRSSALSPATAD